MIQPKIDGAGHYELPARPVTPTFTLGEALRGKLTDKATYQVTLPLHQIAVRTASSAPGSCEPPQQVTNKLVAHYTPPVLAYLEAQSRRRLDPIVKLIETKTNQIDTNRQLLAGWDKKITGTETRTTYSEVQAVDEVAAAEYKITADEHIGYRHHRPVGQILRWAGKAAPYLETLGVAVFAMYALNVDPLDPAGNPLGWTLALVIVVIVLFGQPRFVERAGQGWNRRREAINEAQPAAAEQATRQLVSNGAISAFFAIFITGGLIERFLATGDATNTVVYLLMLLACVLTGIGMPLLDFIATAWDGSTTSREKDSLTSQLDTNLAHHTGLRDGATVLDRDCNTLNAQARDQVTPAILRGAQDLLNPVHHAYAWLRIQIGGSLTSKPPYDRDPGLDLTDPEHPALVTGIPGATPVPLTPIAHRNQRLRNINTRRHSAIDQMQALPQHPWTTRTPTNNYNPPTDT